MLRPQDNGIRECKRLDGMWAFTPDAAGAGRRDEWWRGPLPDARTIAVPASYNDLFVDEQLHDHVGDVWYQRTVFAPAGGDGRRLVLRFDSATHRAAVWLDDELVVEHEGGYTPFEADISHLAAPGRALRVTAVVNNELTFQSVPPGVIQVQPDGTRTQRYYHDFFNYAGLHRSVWLHSTPVDHIDDVTVVTDVDGSTGVVQYRVEVAGGDAAVRVALRDADGTVVAEASGPAGELPRRRRPPVGPGARVSPRTDRGTARRRRCGRPLPPAGRHPQRARGGRAVPDQRCSRSTSMASACTRTTSPAARATTTPR